MNVDINVNMRSLIDSVSKLFLFRRFSESLVCHTIAIILHAVSLSLRF